VKGVRDAQRSLRQAQEELFRPAMDVTSQLGAMVHPLVKRLCHSSPGPMSELRDPRWLGRDNEALAKDRKGPVGDRMAGGPNKRHVSDDRP